MTEKSFSERCYRLLKEVKRGNVTTYKEIANVLGTKAYRAVGSAMRRNRNFSNIPCHRVIKSNGDIGNYSKGQKMKISMLKKEGIRIKHNKIFRLKDYLYKF